MIFYKYLVTSFLLAAVLGRCRSQTVGGHPANLGEVPYHLSLQSGGRHSCSAALAVVFGVQIGITASSCIDKLLMESYIVYAGKLNLNNITDHEQMITSGRLVHYNDRFFSTNTISIFFIPNEFQLNENVKPVPLPEQGQATEGDLIISGYDARNSENLEVLKVPTISETDCRHAYRFYTGPFPDDPICGEHTGNSTCPGDVGGPVVSDSGYLAGIVSSFYDRRSPPTCGIPGLPGVYLEVSQVVDWIKQTVFNQIF